MLEIEQDVFCTESQQVRRMAQVAVQDLGQHCLIVVCGRADNLQECDKVAIQSRHFRDMRHGGGS